MTRIKLFLWRIALVYHFRKVGLYKKRLSAIKHAWRESGQECWTDYFDYGFSARAAISEDLSYGYDD